jgi:hypothetical protein
MSFVAYSMQPHTIFEQSFSCASFPGTTCSNTIELRALMVRCERSIVSSNRMVKVYWKSLGCLFIVLHGEQGPDGEWRHPRAGIRLRSCRRSCTSMLSVVCSSSFVSSSWIVFARTFACRRKSGAVVLGECPPSPRHAP